MAEESKAEREWTCCRDPAGFTPQSVYFQLWVPGSKTVTLWGKIKMYILTILIFDLSSSSSVHDGLMDYLSNLNRLSYILCIFYLFGQKMANKLILIEAGLLVYCRATLTKTPMRTKCAALSILLKPVVAQPVLGSSACKRTNKDNTFADLVLPCRLWLSLGNTSHVCFWMPRWGTAGSEQKIKVIIIILKSPCRHPMSCFGGCSQLTEFFG